MADNFSKERKRAEADLARTQAQPGEKIPCKAAVSDLDQKTARLNSARLKRDAAAFDLKKP